VTRPDDGVRASAGAPGPAPEPICSGKGCRAPGVWALVWNNPKVHAPDRRKVWLACEEHREHLTTFLAARSFLLEVVPREDLQSRGSGDDRSR
jgi:hypothetical protein